MTPLRIKIQERSFRLMKPIFTAVGTIQDRQVLELRLEHSSGAYGLGEASPLPGFSVDDYEECKEQLHELTAEIAGLEPNDLWQGVVLSVQSLNLNPAAQHAVEEAPPCDPPRSFTHSL